MRDVVELVPSISGLTLHEYEVAAIGERTFESATAEGTDSPKIRTGLEIGNPHGRFGPDAALVDHVEELVVLCNHQVVRRSRGNRTPAKQLVELVASDDLLRLRSVETSGRRRQGLWGDGCLAAESDCALLCVDRDRIAIGAEGYVCDRC